jgi:hypothetical protein
MGVFLGGKYLSKVNFVVNEQDLPDWSDPSPIIATGCGYGGTTTSTWELTEKGTLRWHYDPNGEGFSQGYDKVAGWNNSITVYT